MHRSLVRGRLSKSKGLIGLIVGLRGAVQGNRVAAALGLGVSTSVVEKYCGAARCQWTSDAFVRHQGVNVPTRAFEFALPLVGTER